MRDYPARLLLLSGAVALLLAVLSSCSDSGSIDGAEVFKREGCITCHTFKGQGGVVGPDLTYVTKNHSDGWIKDQIRNSKANNPDSRMPEYKHLSGGEVNAIVRYLKS